MPAVDAHSPDPPSVPSPAAPTPTYSSLNRAGVPPVADGAIQTSNAPGSVTNAMSYPKKARSSAVSANRTRSVCPGANVTRRKALSERIGCATEAARSRT